MTTFHAQPDARPAVVLLHRSMSSKGQWTELMAQQESNFRCIAVDLLGYGKSPFPSGAEADVSLAHEVGAVNAALAGRLAPDEPSHLSGHSR
eukprot:gene33769-38165_t